MDLTFGSLFSGGGGLDLGLERAGLKCVFQVENDRHCLTLLKRHWPDVPKNEIRPCVGLVGGDPCPIRSSLGNASGTKKPDMSGYFLAMVARCKPRWVLRENVLSPDSVDFSGALVLLGYRSVVVEMDSAAFTGQSRRREFVVGFDTGKRQKLRCLNSRGRSGISIYQDYVYEGAQWGFRSFSHAERESLQGWPIGWTDGLPNSARERIVGNGVTVPVAEWLGKRIFEANR